MGGKGSGPGVWMYKIRKGSSPSPLEQDRLRREQLAREAAQRKRDLEVVNLVRVARGLPPLEEWK